MSSRRTQAKTQSAVEFNQKYQVESLQQEVNKLLNSPLIWTLAQATSSSAFAITPPLFWGILGGILCLVEFFVAKNWARKYRFIALAVGISSLITSLILWRAGIALGFSWQFLMYDEFNLQILYWMGLSLASVIWLRPMFIKREKYTIQESAEAKALTEILPGETGRVLYEGVSWEARCENQLGVITPQTKVYVLGREGNTLIVAPADLFHVE